MADANEREESPRGAGLLLVQYRTRTRIYTAIDIRSLSSLVPRPGSGPGACGTYCTPLTGARSLARRRARGVRRRATPVLGPGRARGSRLARVARRKQLGAAGDFSKFE